MQIALECKQCGAALEVEEGQKIVKCKYCGSSNAVSFADRFGLYNRANYLRRNNEFDRAIGIYEDILKENPQDAEAYFGVAISKYGVEYVDDPSGSGKIPTLHRTRYVSILQDEDMKNAFLYADVETAEFYREEAEKIDNIQKKIWALTNQQEKYDIFICYKEGDGQGGRTQTSVYAQDIYNELVKRGYKVFFARKTLEQKIGSDYEPIIFAALYSAQVMLLVGCNEEEFQGVWVRNEWTRFRERMANGDGCSLIPLYRHMSPYELPQEFVNLQALDMGKIGFMQDLLDGLEKLLTPSVNATTTLKQTNAVEGSNADSLKKRADLALEQGDFKSASEYIERALDIAPEDAECYIKKVQIATKCRTEADLGELLQSIAENRDYQLALRFANGESRVTYQSYEEKIQNRLREKREAEEAERAAIEKVNAELEKKIQKERKENKEKRSKIIKRISKPIIIVALYFGVLYILVAAIGSFIMGPVFKRYDLSNNFYKFIVERSSFGILPEDWRYEICNILDKASGIDYCRDYDWDNSDDIPTSVATQWVPGGDVWIMEDGTLGVNADRGGYPTGSQEVVQYMECRELFELKKKVKNIKEIYTEYIDTYPINGQSDSTYLICLIDEKGNVCAKELEYTWDVYSERERDLSLYKIYENKWLELEQVNKWEDIVSLKVSACYIFGLQEDGTIVYADMGGLGKLEGINSLKWEDIDDRWYWDKYNE